MILALVAKVAIVVAARGVLAAMLVSRPVLIGPADLAVEVLAHLGPEAAVEALTTEAAAPEVTAAEMTASAEVAAATCEAVAGPRAQSDERSTCEKRN